MNTTIDDNLYAYVNSWWNPRFLEPSVDKDFRLQFDSSALSSGRIGLGILILFWCGFAGFDQFLSPSSKSTVLFVRLIIVTPLFLLLAGFSFSRFAASFYQPLIVLTESLIFAALILVAALYDDYGLVANRLGLELPMLSKDAKFIFVNVWIMVAFVASLAARLRTRSIIVLSAILVFAVLASVYVFKPSGVLVALAGPFVFACIPAVFAGSLMMQRHAVSNYRVTKLLEQSSKELEKSLELLKTMFGRYISTEVMKSLLEDPSALELGGERRKVTIMMTDLRGFSGLSERFEPEQVVQMLNSFFDVMVDVVIQYEGTINEIIGDAMLIIFGAPQQMSDRAQRAIACAIEMQRAIKEVNERNRRIDLPELEMGIGLNDADVIVGNIGSSKRTKYGVVGKGVNVASRIESYTVGGQILISESLRKEAGDVLRIDGELEVHPKGAGVPMRIYEVGGIAGSYNLALEEKEPLLASLAQQIKFRYTVVLGVKHAGQTRLEGFMVRLSKKNAEITLEERVDLHTNLKMNLEEVDEGLGTKDIYGKVIGRSLEKKLSYVVSFTAVPPEVATYFLAFRKHAGRPQRMYPTSPH